jgi:hypothetical protein
MKTLFICLIFYLGLTSSVYSSYDNEYLESLLIQSKEKNISSKRYWNLLLHYESSLLGGVVSNVESKDFFFAKDGKTNPSSELEATLKSFFRPISSLKQHPQCRFIARYTWLNKQLDFDLHKFPSPQCKKYLKWFRDIDPSSISMVFPSYGMGSPLSIYSHTFLKINSKKYPEGSYLNTAISFSADFPPDENPITLTFRGVFGGYQGFFGVEPYYQKVKSYSYLDNRDIFEYYLNLTEAEVERIIFHVWELNEISIDYYFFKKNCSYYLLDLLEIARPSLDLKTQFKLWTIPADTIRLLFEIPEFVIKTTYLPSKLSYLYQRLKVLSEDEKKIILQLFGAKDLSFSKDWFSLSNEQKAYLLEIYRDYLAVIVTPEAAKVRKEVINLRSEIDVVSEEKSYPQLVESPEQGHTSSRWSFGIGLQDEQLNFLDIELRLSLHDFLDPEEGYDRFSEIETGKLRVRSFEDKVIIEDFTILNLTSIFPYDKVYDIYSWRFLMNIKQDHSQQCFNCPIFNLQTGTGIGFQVGRTLSYMLIDAVYHYGDVYEKDFQLGGNIGIGSFYKLGRAWKTKLSLHQFRFYYGEKDMYWEKKGVLRYTIDDNQDIRLEGKAINSYSEVLLGWQIFF